MSDNIEKIGEDKFKVLGVNGDELDNSPYETEKKAKQAFNAHKLAQNNKDEDTEKTEETEDDEEDEDKSDILNNKSDKEDKNDNSESSIMSLLGNKYVIGAGLAVLGWKYYNSSDSRTRTVEPADEETVEPEDSGGDDLDSGKKRASEMFI